MQAEILRIIVTVALAALLMQQARRAAHYPRRRLAFLAGASAFILFTLANLAALLALDPTWLTMALSGAGLVLILTAVLALLAAYRNGEMEDQIRRARSLLDAQRQQREE